MRRGPLLLLFVTTVMVSLGCEARVSIGARCTRDTECGELRCRYGRCRAQCASASDCAQAGAFCVGAVGAGVCTVPTLDRCSLDCGDGLECVEEQCLVPCTEGCLPGSTCVASHCVSDATDAGMPDAAVLDASVPDAPTPVDAGPRDGGLGVGPTRHTICNGYEHICAIGSGNRVYCWGNNHAYQVGDGVLEPHGPPCPIVDPMDDCVTPAMLPVVRERSGTIVEEVVSLGCGEAHTCALTSAGEVVCWGYGALGDMVAHTAAVTMIDSGADELAVGWRHACARVAGEVRCWGENGDPADGRLGVPDVTWVGAPVRADGFPELTLLAAGAGFTCGAEPSGGVRCHGIAGQGVADPAGRVVSGVTHPRALVGGNVQACALADEGLVCWGEGSAIGSGGATLPDCSGNCRRDAAPVVGSASLTLRALSVGGGQHVCVATEPDGEVRCWGYQPYGECGADPTTTVRTMGEPIMLEGGGTLRDVVELATGASSCARTATGDVYCWGFNSYGQLGMFETVPVGGTILSQPYPTAHHVPVP